MQEDLFLIGTAFLHEDKIWNEKIECASREEMRIIQSERLCETVKRIYHNVPAYRKKMQEVGLTAYDIHDIGDLHKLPFTVKNDLRDKVGQFLYTKTEKRPMILPVVIEV